MGQKVTTTYYSALVVHVLAAGQDRVEPGTQFNQRPDAAVHLDAAFVFFVPFCRNVSLARFAWIRVIRG